LASRNLLLRFWAIGYSLIFIFVTLTAALWIPMGMTKDICQNNTSRQAWSCDLAAYEYWPGKEDYQPEDMENFSIGDDGTTAKEGDEEWSPSTFGSHREPHCAGYNYYTDWRDGDGILDCNMMIGLGAFAWFVGFYLIEVPIGIYLVCKLGQYRMYDPKKAAVTDANPSMNMMYNSAPNHSNSTIEMTQHDVSGMYDTRKPAD
jgi:hypothetical protein